jgi:hypothetical protein
VSTWLRPQRGARPRPSPAPLSCAPARQPAYASIRQHTSAAYGSIRQRMLRYLALQRVSLHTSAYVSIRQHTSAYVSIRQRMLRYLALQRVSLPQAYVMAPHAWRHRWRPLRCAYVSIRRHTSACGSIRAWRLASSVAAAAARMQANSASIREIS